MQEPAEALLPSAFYAVVSAIVRFVENTDARREDDATARHSDSLKGMAQTGAAQIKAYTLQ